VITKIDHDNIDFDRTVSAVKERFSNDAVLVTFPVTTGPSLSGFVDVLSMKLLQFVPSANGKFIEGPIPAEHQERAAHLHEELIEKLRSRTNNSSTNFLSTGHSPTKTSGPD